MSINIIKHTSTCNTTYKKNRPLTYIVLHYTAGTSSKTGSATSTANYFAKPSTGASADFIVDDTTIVQYNPDIKNRYCWSVGGSKYSSVTTKYGATYYGKCTNTNSINIELCSTKSNKKTLLATDTNFYFTDEVFYNGVKLVQYLMKEYSIDISHVITHHHVTGKICPNPWFVNESRTVIWNNFINKVKEGINVGSVDTPKSSTPAPTQSYKVKVTVNALNIRKGPGINYPIAGCIKDKGIYTIIKEENGFGKLKSGTGYISLAYTKKI